MATPDAATIQALLDEGMTQTEIARAAGVSRQRIHQIIKEAGYESLITEVTENLPWEVERQFLTNTIYKAMRLHGHWMLDNDALTKGSLGKLRAFHRKLVAFNQVIDYDPAYQAIPGISNTPGFAYLPRRPEDGNYIIRLRHGVKLTPVGEKIWQLPKELP